MAINIYTSIEKELQTANESRQAGNEGRARVCARRAAGIAAGEYFRLHALPDPGPSAYDRLHILASASEIDPRFREIAQHLILRVNEEFRLPTQIDLIAEARQLVAYLLETH
ncbi:MAG: hypothetical protein H8E28_07780 [Anaerolineae bacterium]|nr:hypothetical protein [Anaerolineae bacterium]MBL6966208.1 hypothetical protein [Anaerolineales bacterium]